MGDFSYWYMSIPSITKYWFTGATIIPLLGRFGILGPYMMYLEWNLFFNKLEVKF